MGKATQVASNASKNLRNMKSSDDDPASLWSHAFAEWKLDEKQKFFEAKNKDDATCYVNLRTALLFCQRSEMFEGWASVLLKVSRDQSCKDYVSWKESATPVIFMSRMKGVICVFEHFFVVNEKKECVKSIRDEFYKAKHF